MYDECNHFDMDSALKSCEHHQLRPQVPLLPIFAEATASPVQILCRLLPPALAAQLPQGFLRQLPMHQAEYLEASCAGAAGDLAHLGLASAAWAAQMDSLLLPQQCVCPIPRNQEESTSTASRSGSALDRNSKCTSLEGCNGQNV